MNEIELTEQLKIYPKVRAEFEAKIETFEREIEGLLAPLPELSLLATTQQIREHARTKLRRSNEAEALKISISEIQTLLEALALEERDDLERLHALRVEQRKLNEFKALQDSVKNLQTFEA